MPQEPRRRRINRAMYQSQEYAAPPAAYSSFNSPEENAAKTTNAFSIDLMELFYHIMSKAKYVVLAAFLGTVLAGCYTRYIVSPLYQATSKLYILNQDGLTIEVSDLQIGKALMMDYQEVFKTWEVHEMVRTELNLDYSYAQLQSMLTITNPGDTRLLYITVKSEDPQLSADLANAYARAAKEFIYRVMESTEPNEFSIALVPSTSISSGLLRSMLTGFALGLILSVGILTLQFLFDDKPHTQDDVVKAADIPILGVVPFQEAATKKNRRTETRRRAT